MHLYGYKSLLLGLGRVDDTRLAVTEGEKDTTTVMLELAHSNWREVSRGSSEEKKVILCNFQGPISVMDCDLTFRISHTFAFHAHIPRKCVWRSANLNQM